MPSRRRLLAALGGTAVAALAGCTEEGDPWPGSGLAADETPTPTPDPNVRPCSEQETVPDVTVRNTRSELLDLSLLLIEVADGEKRELADRAVGVPPNEDRVADRLFVETGQRAQIDRYYLDIRDGEGARIETVPMGYVAAAPARRGVTLWFRKGGLNVSRKEIQTDSRFNDDCY